MIDFLSTIQPPILALLSGTLCFLCTTLGASGVFLFKNTTNKTLTTLLAAAGGVMIASSFFSLLMPAVDYCNDNAVKEVLFVVLGFLCGGGFIALSNLLFDKKIAKINNPHINKYKRNFLLVSSITLHNIPEGMAIGVAFGYCAYGDATAVVAALGLAVGIGLQNIPEGASVALPLRRDGMSRRRSFCIGSMSGVVEPIFALLACFLALLVEPALPFLLAFSAGAMMTVAIVELIPESLNGSKNQTILFTTLGFCIMALLDIVLG